MKIVLFGPDRRVGALEGDHVIDLNCGSLLAFIEEGLPRIEEARQAIVRAERVFLASEVELHAPWPGRRVACAAVNYASHGKKASEKVREEGPWGFWKELLQPTDLEGDLLFPPHAKLLDYEGEVAIVIGKKGKGILASQIEEFVFGVTLVNDWSIRDDFARVSRPYSYNLAKSFDGSLSIGPSIVLDELDFHDVAVETRVNGELRQKFNSKEMIYSFGELLEHLSRNLTFYPGDVISGGTGAGTALDTSREFFLKRGDLVEVYSPKIGLLRNRII